MHRRKVEKQEKATVSSSDSEHDVSDRSESKDSRIRVKAATTFLQDCRALLRPILLGFIPFLLGVGFIIDQLVGGLFVGLGLGFLCMALSKKKYI